MVKTPAAIRPSRLTLGTVQFGMPYGVANRTGQPEYIEVLAILEAALEGGVNCFDTAAAYGTSEEVLGRALQELGVSDDVLLVTKVQPLTPDELNDAELASQRITQSVADSRARLGRDCLPVVMFHREADAVHLQVLQQLQRAGWLQHCGVSCDHQPEPAIKFASSGEIAALQLPGNLLDRRCLRGGVLEAAAPRGVWTFVRSIYLQGLLLMPDDEVPTALREVIPIRHAVTNLAKAAGLTLPELAMRYVLSFGDVTSIVVGVETVAQMRDNLELFSRGPLPEDVLAAVEATVLELSERVITPHLWATGD